MCYIITGMTKKLTPKQSKAIHANRRAQAGRNELLDALARRAGWSGWSQYATAAIRGAVEIEPRSFFTYPNPDHAAPAGAHSEQEQRE